MGKQKRHNLLDVIETIWVETIWVETIRVETIRVETIWVETIRLLQQTFPLCYAHHWGRSPSKMGVSHVGGLVEHKKLIRLIASENVVDTQAKSRD